MSVGLPPDQFWRLTLREIGVILDGAAKRLEREHNDRAWAVWHVAYLTAYAPQNGKKFPRLKSLLWRDKAAGSTTTGWRTQFNAFAAWASSFKKG